jgi:hypothetical protein
MRWFKVENNGRDAPSLDALKDAYDGEPFSICLVDGDRRV